MKHTVRAFSVGLLTAGLILLVVFYFVEDSYEESLNHTTEELITRIEEDGYRVITEEQYIGYTVTNNQQDTEKEDDTNEDHDDTEETEDDIDGNEENDEDEMDTEEDQEEEEESSSTVSITIESGMASSHISSLLEDEGLIEDADTFTNYLLENDYSLYIQIGEHELETGMSHYEIAERLTN